GWPDAITGAGDHVILAADVPEIAVIILAAEIAGEQEFAGKFFGRRFRIFPVFDHGDGIGLAHADDAALAPRQFPSLFVDDAHIEAGRRLAHRTRPDRKQLRIVADREVAFGLTEHLVGFDAEGRAHPVRELDAERSPAGEDAAQPYAGMFDVGLPH